MKRWRNCLGLVARLLLGAVFIYAGLLKAADAPGFAGQIAAYRLLPQVGNYLVAATLPWIEILAGTLLLSGFKARPAALLLALLNLVFMGALASAWGRGLKIDCGCFRPGAASSSIPLALLRDAGLLALAVLVLWHRPAPRKP